MIIISTGGSSGVAGTQLIPMMSGTVCGNTAMLCDFGNNLRRQSCQFVIAGHFLAFTFWDCTIVLKKIGRPAFAHICELFHPKKLSLYVWNLTTVMVSLRTIVFGRYGQREVSD
jgi:hypothetical protein